MPSVEHPNIQDSNNKDANSRPGHPLLPSHALPSQFTAPPKPILNKSDLTSSTLKQLDLPNLQTNLHYHQTTSFQEHQSSQQPSHLRLQDSVTTPVNTTLSQVAFSSTTLNTTPNSLLKHTNSISFNVPSNVEKSHRGSISARPSQINITGGIVSYPKVSSPSGTSSRQPSSTQTRIVSSNGVGVGPNQISTGGSSVTVAPERRKSPSPFSSRQGSSNGDYLQFHAKSQDLNFPARPVSSAQSQQQQQQQNSDYSRNNSISSNISFHSPLSLGATSDFSDPSVPTEPINAPPKKKSIPKTIVASPTGPIVPFTQYMQREDDKKIHILIGATGSVATIKVPMIIDKLQKIYGPEKVSIQLVVTKPAEHFLKGSKISSEVKIWRDSDEWSNTFGKPGDPILHVELRKWADIFLIAPLSANTLAKILNGLCDNLLTSIIRSWNPTIPILCAPAMNTLMYTHPMTKKHLNILQEDFKFIKVLKPVEKVLVCGDIGMGGMREWTDIVDTVMRKIKEIKLAKLAELASQGLSGEGVEEDDEDDEDDDDDDEDDDDDDDFDDENSDSDDLDSNDEDEEVSSIDQDDLDMELDDAVSETVKGSVDNLSSHMKHTLSLTGDLITDHRFNSTADLI